jgi:hypothetical protein
MNSLTRVTAMLGHSPYLAIALTMTFALLAVEAWHVRDQSRACPRSLDHTGTAGHPDET